MARMPALQERMVEEEMLGRNGSRVGRRDCEARAGSGRGEEKLRSKVAPMVSRLFWGMM